MTTLSRYICGHIFMRFLGSLIGLVALALLFDLLDAGDDLLDDGIASVADLIGYIFLRLPSLASQMLPFAALTGSLISVTTLLRHRELVIIWGIGQSPYALMRAMAPLAVILFSMQLLIDTMLVPPTLSELRVWQVGAFKHRFTGVDGGYLWLRSEGDVVRMSSFIDKQNRLEAVTIFRRDENGMLESQWRAESATQQGEGWRLDNVTIIPTRGDSTFEETRLWNGTIEPEKIKLIATPPRELSLSQLWTVITNGAFGLKPIHSYLLWINAKPSLALVPALMALLPFSLARQAPRQQPWMTLHFPAAVLGFMYVVISGLVIALGESGLINPYLASWLPPASLALVILAIPLLSMSGRPFTRAQNAGAQRVQS